MAQIGFRLAGKKYKVTSEEVEEKVSFAVPKATDKYYVLVKGRPFPPKQVLSLTLDLPPVKFTTMAANAILSRLGFELHTIDEDIAKPKTESERLFEILLGTRGLIDFKYEPPIPGVSARPDYMLTLGNDQVLFEIKEFQPAPEDFRLGAGYYDPYGSIRSKIQDGAKKFKDLKSEKCAIVLYNAGKPLVDLRWQFVYASMLGDLTWSAPFDSRQGMLVESPATEFKYGGHGSMHRHKDGVAVEPQKTRINAVIVLERLGVGNRRFKLAVKRREAELRRELTLEEYLGMSNNLRATGADSFLTELRTVVCVNPYSPPGFPEEIFSGPYDERYGPLKGHIQRTFVGEQMKRLEDEEAISVEHQVSAKDSLVIAPKRQITFEEDDAK
jgi:hypothetical protein